MPRVRISQMIGLWLSFFFFNFREKLSIFEVIELWRIFYYKKHKTKIKNTLLCIRDWKGLKGKNWNKKYQNNEISNDKISKSR
jgi:hypothetical protein